jgi:Zn-dependent protease with chaperone function
MDFFERQDAARQKTGVLVFYFITAVVLIIISVYLAIAGILFATGGDREIGPGLHGLWDPQLLGLVAIGTSTLVAGGSLYKIAALSGGGRTVAELLGGRLVHPDTHDPDERRLLNIVEEMSIASGVPVPPVYLLENEPGINAFAAGHTPSDAVVAVTAGALRMLSRDELQGVIGHEFSHILNGDMGLNIRLMGVLHGILLIGLTGWLIFRSTSNGSVRAESRRDGGDRKGGNPLPLIGLALYLIGYVGVFFANLIKAAVSRQREYLADASGVQFTRNPDGLAGALKKIGALAEGSHIQDPHAEEASHMFFGDAVGGMGTLLGLLASHPPLIDRIRQLDPSFNGDFSQVRFDSPPLETSDARPGAAQTPVSAMAFSPAQAVARVGTIDAGNLAYAADAKDAIAPALAAAVREPLGAQAVIFSLLIDPSESVRTAQLGWVATHALPALARATSTLMTDAQRLAPELRLPLVELAVPALRQMTPAQFHDFYRSVEVLVQADRKTTLFEYALQRLLIRHVVTSLRPIESTTVKITTVPPLVEPTALVLSALARLGGASPEQALRAFGQGTGSLGWSGAQLELAPPEALGLRAVDRALETLATASPQLKKAVLEACTACIFSDGHVTVPEGELLRAISYCLGCPMPPMFAKANSSPSSV